MSIRNRTRLPYISNKPLPPSPQYIYKGQVTHVYDADTWIVRLDLGLNTEKTDLIIRLYGVNAREIKRNKARRIFSDHVKQGYADRDFILTELGEDPSKFKKTPRYQSLHQPVDVVVTTIKDKSGKFGRLLAIIHHNGVNLNELLRDRVGSVEFYDGNTWPSNTPIVAPDNFRFIAKYVVKTIPDPSNKKLITP